MCLDNSLSLGWVLRQSSLFLQNFLEGALFFLIHSEELIAQVGVRGILSGLRAQIVDSGVEHEKLFAVIGHKRSFGIFELRFGIGGELIDGLHVSGLSALDIGQRFGFEQARSWRNRGL